MSEALESNLINILTSEVVMVYAYDITLEDEDYTIGKVLEYVLYSKYFEGEKYCLIVVSKRNIHMILSVLFVLHLRLFLINQWLHNV